MINTEEATDSYSTKAAVTTLASPPQQQEGYYRLSADASSSSSSSSYSSSSSGLEGLDTLPRFLAVWGVLVVLVTLALLTLVSNGAMLTMFLVRRSVRRCKNIYVASLAAADLGIGLTLPLATLEQVERRWALQGVGCHLYQTVRCSLLYVSLLSILLISLDRWWSIHYPFTYRVRQSKKLAAVAVGLVWTASFALHVPPVLLWDHFDVAGGVDVAAGTEQQQQHHQQQQQTLLPPTAAAVQTEEALLSALTTTTTTSTATTTNTTAMRFSLSSDGSGFFDQSLDSSGGGGDEKLKIKTSRRSEEGERGGGGGGGRCELPYELNFSYVLTSSVVMYFFPLLALWVLNLSLYFKITRRKSIKIRRSLSVNDNYLLPFWKSSSESETVELRSTEQRQRLLQAARAGRRHTLAFMGHVSVVAKSGGGGGGGGVGPVYYHPSLQTGPRQYSSSFRRVSIYEAFSGIGTNLAAVGGGAPPHLPRVTSCGRLPSGGTNGGGFGFGSGHRQSVCSAARKQSADLVKELLVRQDKKAARLLGLLVTVFTLCWLPFTVTSVLHARSGSTVPSWLRDLTSWVLVTNSAINPFLYGLLNAEFRKILKDWFYFRRTWSALWRLKHAMLYWSLPPAGNADSDGDLYNQDPVVSSINSSSSEAVRCQGMVCLFLQVMLTATRLQQLNLTAWITPGDQWSSRLKSFMNPVLQADDGWSPLTDHLGCTAEAYQWNI
ncbi:histamine H3 receptor-like [Babylonia areolata]|uniref:histamine H3 receptor-like n=1 Tax=Babylonia areolata TaxID=304850 RepID=UPI003FD4617B